MMLNEGNDWDAKVYKGPPRKAWIRMPVLPPSLNAWTRKHWSVRHNEILRLTECLRFLAVREGIPCFPRAEILLRYYFRDARRRDPDNYVPKTILDALRHGGIIADDNALVLRLPQPEFLVDRKVPRTEIVITEWEEAEGVRT